MRNALILAGLFCLPVTGFIFGFIICSDCGDGYQSIPGRIFLGMIYSFFTTITLGEPWTGGGAVVTNTSLRIYILFVFGAILVISYMFRAIIKNRRNSNE